MATFTSVDILALQEEEKVNAFAYSISPLNHD